MLKKNPKSVKVVYKFFTLSSHRFSKQAAAAALAAERQGKFWEYHNELFKNYRRLNDKKFVEIAQKLGLNVEKFNADRHDPVILAKLNLEHEEGEKIGVRGIPAIFLNGRRVSNGNINNLQNMVEKQLEKQH